MERNTQLEKLKESIGTTRTTNICLITVALLLLILVLKSFPGGFVIESLIVIGAFALFYKFNKKKE